MSQAVDYLYCMFTNPFFGDKIFGKWVVWGSLLLLVEWIQRDKQHALQFANIRPFNYKTIRWTIYVILICSSFAAYITHIEYNNTFIYFQF